MKNNINEVIQQLDVIGMKPTKEGNTFRSRCPVCNSTDERVLTIFNNENGSIGYYCHKNQCSFNEIIATLGLNKEYKNIEREEYSSYGVIKKYPYRDKFGNTLYYKNRYKDKKFTVSHLWKGREYIGKGNYKDMLYNLDEVVKKNNILLVEGEKDADNLIQLGFTATTKFNTSSSLDEDMLNVLKDKNIVLFYDNDNKGIESLEKNKDLLSPIARSLKVVHLPHKARKNYDISDYIEEYRATEIEVLQLIQQAEKIPTGKYYQLYYYSSYKDYISKIENNKIKYEFKTKDGTVTTNQNKMLNYLTTHIPLININNQLYIYEKGVYKKINNNYINMIIQDHLLGDYKTQTLRNGVASLWVNDSSVMINPKKVNNMVDLTQDKLLLNLKNGIYNVITKEIESHSFENYSTVQLNAEYNPDISKNNGKVFMQFINDVAPSKDIQILLQEILGYAISPLNNAKKAFILYGESNTGKSVFLNLITELLGQENISAVPFQQLDNRFSTASLYNKTVNICADLPKSTINDDSVFKQLTGGDIVKAEFKGQDEFEFINKAKLIFSTNSLPENYGDEGNAFYNRLILIPFNQVIPEYKQDKNLSIKLSKELDYIFMWALEGLERLIDNNIQFSIPKESEELLDNYRVSKIDNTLKLISEMIEENVLVNNFDYKYINQNTEIALYTMSIFKRLVPYSKKYLSEVEQRAIFDNRKAFQDNLQKENYFLSYKPVNMNGKIKKCYVIKSENKYLKIV